MPSLTEKETLTLLDKAEYLGRAVRTHQSQVTTRLDEIYGASASADGGESRKVDWDFVQQSNAGLIDTAVKDVRGTGHNLRLDLVKVSQIRLQRDGVLEDLSECHDSLKLSIEGTYGPDKLEVVGLDAPMARRYLGVREQCTEIVGRLRLPNTQEQLGKPRANQEHLPMEKLADGLEGDVQRFTKAYEDVSEMNKVVHESRAARNEARLNMRRIYTNVARMQEGMFRLAGLDELADRIRVTIRSRPKPKNEPETGDPAQPDSPADSSPTAAGSPADPVEEHPAEE